ncbi:MAG: methylmalonyl-CoA mutase [Acidobacteria bacterium]|nr:methylmalonyl-CoA mutase [Acidobacteriota bacterium]MBI3655920.1 methylmalonyl-CoA mutase [Acidobacteriota bacterium]
MTRRLVVSIAGKGGTRMDRKRNFTTSSGLRIKEIYLPDDTQSINYSKDIGMPGEFPFTRGIHRSMYRSKLWTMRQYAGYAGAQESNRRYRYLLNQGQTGLSIAFDLPTQMGLDSDHPQAAGEVGKVGVAIDSLEDMQVLFEGIPLDQVSTSMTINATAAILLALYLAVAKKRGIAAHHLSGTVQNDLLKEYIARGTYIYPPEASLRITTDIFSFCRQHLPKWNTISISGYHIREAGATAVQEVAFTLANGITYVERALAAGLPVDEFAQRISFFFDVHNNLLEEVAKFRAARRLWARIMRDRFGARDPRAMMLRFHAQTAGCSLTAQQPQVNVVRVTVQALAAVLGGAQSLHTNSRDEALALPTAEAALLALRTQQVLAYESGVADAVDPLAGSYMLESLTNEIEAGAKIYWERIEALGGVLKAIESGYIQKEIHQAAYNYQKKVESGEETVIGLNTFKMEEGQAIPVLTVDPNLEEEQVARVQRLKQNRNQEAVQQSLRAITDRARSGENLMPVILDAVEAYATVGEIADAMRVVFGEYREVVF